MKASSLEGVYTIREIAQRFKVSEWSVRREIRENRLRAKRIGRCIRVVEADLEFWLATDDNLDGGVTQ
jgi:excisionase family DNA binding protein